LQIFKELQRRNVVRVAIGYIVSTWLLMQVADLVLENIGAPEWVMQTIMLVLALGFPVVLFFSWAYEVTPEGIKRESEIDRNQSITHVTGRKLDRAIVAALVIALAYFAYDKFVLDPQRDAALIEAANQAATEPKVVADSDKSIAVLPFVNMSDDKDYFADGLSEELLNLLAKVPDLKVAGRTSSFVFKGKNEDLKAIGNALRVAYVLEGSVRRSGEKLRITAQLIKVEDGFHMWSATYDRQMADIFDIQDEVASAITEALKLQLAPEAGRLTDSPEAYALYLKALALAIVDQPGDILNGLELLDQAIAIDPTFAKAYELQAQFHWSSGGWVVDNPLAQAATFNAASKALELDPSLAAAQTFAVIASPNWTWQSVSKLEQLVTAQPNYVGALVATSYSLTGSGYFNDALKLADRIIELEPQASLGYRRKGQVLLAMGRRQEAHLALEKAIELGNVIAFSDIGMNLLISGDDEQAIPYLQAFSDATGSKLESVRDFIEYARDPQNGKAFLDEFIEQTALNATDILGRITPYIWYLAFGYVDDYWQAIDSLNDGETGWTNSDMLENTGISHADSGFRQHPRYLQKAAEDGMLELWEERGPPDHCKKLDDSWVCE
jgi:adenylate cyclase